VFKLAPCPATPLALAEFAGCPDFMSNGPIYNFGKKRGGSHLFILRFAC
jgi:hypothetical protein